MSTYGLEPILDRTIHDSSTLPIFYFRHDNGDEYEQTVSYVLEEISKDSLLFIRKIDFTVSQ